MYIIIKPFHIQPRYTHVFARCHEHDVIFGAHLSNTLGYSSMGKSVYLSCDYKLSAVEKFWKPTDDREALAGATSNVQRYERKQSSLVIPEDS